MATKVTPLHYVTIEFRLYDEKQENQAMEASGQHRFLYGVESWIDGVDQRLESLEEGEYLELVLGRSHSWIRWSVSRRMVS